MSDEYPLRDDFGRDREKNRAIAGAVGQCQDEQEMRLKSVGLGMGNTPTTSGRMSAPYDVSSIYEKVHRRLDRAEIEVDHLRQASVFLRNITPTGAEIAEGTRLLRILGFI